MRTIDNNDNVMTIDKTKTTTTEDKVNDDDK